MFILATICISCLICFALLNLYWGHQIARLYQAHLNRTEDSTYAPKATVLLSLRGNDPFLVNCLSGLLNQNYPDYKVRIIIDHLDDPAYAFVTQYLAEHSHPHCQVSIREATDGTCGLKNASLVQAIQDLDDEVEVVAWLDADVVPHRNWLRDLVAPLQNPRVGVTSGIRWYAPRHANPGTMIRHAWNTGALLQMLSLDIAWGGSIALSREVFQSPLLKETLSRILWEDTGLKAVASQLDRELVFVPAATMVNAESIPFQSCFRYMSRQLVNVRLYHSRWWLIAGLGLMTASVQTILLILIGLFLAQGNLLAAGVSAGAMLAASGCVALAIYRISLLIHQTIRARGDDYQRKPLQTLFYLWITLYIFCGAIIAALRTKSIDWRGVQYQISGPFDVRITHYEPYQEPAATSKQVELDFISL